jgi:hypothetical protein
MIVVDDKGVGIVGVTTIGSVVWCTCYVLNISTVRYECNNGLRQRTTLGVAAWSGSSDPQCRLMY